MSESGAVVSNPCHAGMGRRLLVQLFAANVLIIAALKIFSFRSVLAAVSRFADLARTRHPGGRDAIIAEARLRLSMLRALGPFAGKCLSRSMALYGVLRRYGIPSEIRIGVRRDSGEFAAHAWVEAGGRPINAGPRVRVRHATFFHSFGDCAESGSSWPAGPV